MPLITTDRFVFPVIVTAPDWRNEWASQRTPEPAEELTQSHRIRNPHHCGAAMARDYYVDASQPPVKRQGFVGRCGRRNCLACSRLNREKYAAKMDGIPWSVVARSYGIRPVVPLLHQLGRIQARAVGMVADPGSKPVYQYVPGTEESYLFLALPQAVNRDEARRRIEAVGYAAVECSQAPLDPTALGAYLDIAFRRLPESSSRFRSCISSGGTWVAPPGEAAPPAVLDWGATRRLARVRGGNDLSDDLNSHSRVLTPLDCASSDHSQPPTPVPKPVPFMILTILGGSVQDWVTRETARGWLVRWVSRNEAWLYPPKAVPKAA